MLQLTGSPRATKFIGLGHYSRTGKDTLANALVTAYRELNPVGRILKLSFASKLKDVCHQLYGWAGMREAEFYDTPEGEPKRDMILPAIGKTPVQVWVAMGTPAVRDCVYKNTWIDYVFRGDHQADVVVIPDVRFPNEVEAVKAVGGLLVKVVRPGVEPRDTVADKALLDFQGWDFTIGESGQLGDLVSFGRRIALWADGRSSVCAIGPTNAVVA